VGLVRGLVLGMGTLLAACVTTYDRGAALYREGDLRGALDVWRTIEPNDREHGEAAQQMGLVEAEFGRLLRRYEKNAQFYEEQGQLAEGLLAYRLALKLEPEQPQVLERVQSLVRTLEERKRTTLSELQSSLKRDDLPEAIRQLREFEKLDPLLAETQPEVRQARALVGAEVRQHLDAGKASFDAGNNRRAKRNVDKVIALEPENVQALGLLSMIERRSKGLPIESSGGESAMGPGAEQPEVTAAEIRAEGEFRAAARAEQRNDLFRALQKYQAAINADPSNAPARAALQSLRERMRPQIPELEGRAKKHFQEEDLQNAVLSWRRVLLIDPTRPGVAFNLERAQRMLARLEEIQAGGGQ